MYGKQRTFIITLMKRVEVLWEKKINELTPRYSNFLGLCYVYKVNTSFYETIPR